MIALSTASDPPEAKKTRVNPGGDRRPIGVARRSAGSLSAPVKCVSQMAYETCGCPDERTCGLRLVMLDLRNAIAHILDHTSLADVLQRVDQARLHLPELPINPAGE